MGAFAGELDGSKGMGRHLPHPPGIQYDRDNFSFKNTFTTFSSSSTTNTNNLIVIILKADATDDPVVFNIVVSDVAIILKP